MTPPPLLLFKKKNWYIPIGDLSVLKKNNKKWCGKLGTIRNNFLNWKVLHSVKETPKTLEKKKRNLQNSLLRLYRFKVFGFYICNFRNKKVYKFNYHYLNNHEFKIINLYFAFDQNGGSVGLATPLCAGDICSNFVFQIRDSKFWLFFSDSFESLN